MEMQMKMWTGPPSGLESLLSDHWALSVFDVRTWYNVSTPTDNQMAV